MSHHPWFITFILLTPRGLCFWWCMLFPVSSFKGVTASLSLRAPALGQLPAGLRLRGAGTRAVMSDDLHATKMYPPPSAEPGGMQKYKVCGTPRLTSSFAAHDIHSCATAAAAASAVYAIPLFSAILSRNFLLDTKSEVLKLVETETGCFIFSAFWTRVQTLRLERGQGEKKFPCTGSCEQD